MSAEVIDMNKKKKIDKLLLEQPLQPEKKFTTSKIRIGVGLLTLVTTFLLTIYYWNSLAWYVKLISGFIVLSLSPSVEDFKFLTMSYASYKEEWNKFHESKNKS